MKIEDQKTMIGFIIGFSLGLISGWATGVNEDTFLEETEDTYGCHLNIDTSYKAIDTIVMSYDWGREEIYIYEYN